MSESSFEYRQARAEQGANCSDPRDLVRYLRRVAMDAHSLRQGLTHAINHVFAGSAPPSEETGDLPSDRVERALFEDTMGSMSQLLVADPAIATALRHSMRLLEDAADAAHLVGVLLERLDGGAAMGRLSAESGIDSEENDE